MKKIESEAINVQHFGHLPGKYFPGRWLKCCPLIRRLWANEIHGFQHEVRYYILSVSDHDFNGKCINSLRFFEKNFPPKTNKKTRRPPNGQKPGFQTYSRTMHMGSMGPAIVFVIYCLGGRKVHQIKNSYDMLCIIVSRAHHKNLVTIRSLLME
jgi:hypothetical protein